VCKYAKILELRKYLFQRSTQSSMNQFPDGSARFVEFVTCNPEGF
jgi:hypothetical protein